MKLEKYCSKLSEPIFDSTILTSKVLQESLKDKLTIKFDRLMRASVDGYTAQVFHEKCNNKGATLTLAKANYKIFGAYTNLPWTNANDYKSGDPYAFVFRIANIEDAKK